MLEVTVSLGVCGLYFSCGHIHEMLPREYLDFVQREMEIGKLAQKGSQDGKN